MVTQPGLPDFFSAPWYSDPRDHRCPHDAWLESVEISEPAEGARKENRQTAITIKLLGAYHDGNIVLRYRGVTTYSLASSSCTKGLSDWLSDQFSQRYGMIVHSITWAGHARESQSQWQIEAESVTYEWVPITPGS